ncbi:MAG TPA: DUF1080 domain-containing protein, partial [Phycisphaerales bacterium]|nr:DUF1080 domain-containing protein [Phycisphaerales bacterium]
MFAARTLIGVLAAALLGGASARAQQNRLSEQEAQEGWELLFSGDSLEGWTTSGNPEAWLVLDGEIHTTGNGGWWLRTEKRYRDFDLKLDFLVPENGNSGVGLRG